MTKLADHPTVIQIRNRVSGNGSRAPAPLDATWLRTLCIEAGADDVGFVEIERPALDSERADILNVFPRAKSLISFVCKMNREPIRSPARSIANLEFHHRGEDVNGVARNIISALEEHHIRAINPAMGFPMEMQKFPEKIWVVSHKPVAVEAGLGHMGIHRNVIHPKFGNFILLGTVILDAEISKYMHPIDYNPCLECKLCVAACPTGAIGSDGSFDFSACYTHNYREFMGGFTDWVENIADSKNASDYRHRVTDSESVSMWQSLSYGANYKAAYCMAVCPAGEDVIGPYLADKGAFRDDLVRPLQEKKETIYVVPDSDAESHVAKRFPNKSSKRVGNGLRPTSVRGFLGGLPLIFQRQKAKELDARYHFDFTGQEEVQATIVIRNQSLDVKMGLIGKADLRVTADSRTWLSFLSKDRSIISALVRRKVRLKGSPKLLLAFARCFPS